MIPALAQVSTLPWPLERDLEDYAAAQVPAIELWLTKLEEFLKTHSVAETKQRFAQHGLQTPVAAGQGGLLSSQGPQREAAWELFRRRLDLCAELGIGTLVVAGDIDPPRAQQDLDRVAASLTQVAQEAGRRGLRVALEFQARAGFANNLQTAAALVHETGSPHLGLCLDAFHYHCGPSKPDDLGYATAQNLFHVQLCDLADVPRELASDRDRILPGDGEIGLAHLVAHLDRIGYAGPVSIELLNPQLWQVPPRNLAEIAATALRKVLGQARME